MWVVNKTNWKVATDDRYFVLDSNAKRKRGNAGEISTAEGFNPRPQLLGSSYANSGLKIIFRQGGLFKKPA